jgi:hypothetical protein
MGPSRDAYLDLTPPSHRGVRSGARKAYQRAHNGPAQIWCRSIRQAEGISRRIRLHAVSGAERQQELAVSTALMLPRNVTGSVGIGSSSTERYRPMQALRQQNIAKIALPPLREIPRRSGSSIFRRLVAPGGNMTPSFSSHVGKSPPGSPRLCLEDAEATYSRL